MARSDGLSGSPRRAGTPRVRGDSRSAALHGKRRFRERYSSGRCRRRTPRPFELLSGLGSRSGLWRHGSEARSWTCHSSLPTSSTRTLSCRTTYRGHEGWLRAARTWIEPFEWLRLDLEEIIDAATASSPSTECDSRRGTPASSSTRVLETLRLWRICGRFETARSFTCRRLRVQRRPSKPRDCRSSALDERRLFAVLDAAGLVRSGGAVRTCGPCEPKVRTPRDLDEAAQSWGTITQDPLGPSGP
jgi:hypothetical protein